MNPYLLTVTFLMLMGLLTSSEVVRFSHHAKEQEFFSNSLDSKAEIQWLAALSRLDDYIVHDKDEPQDPSPDPKRPARKKTEKKSDRPRKSVSLEFNLDRPPNNSRLNIHLLMHADLQLKKHPKDFTLYETGARLMRLLYQNAPFYQSGCEYEILDELLNKADEASNFTSPEELSSLNFTNQTLQETFCFMLKGHNGFPSLLNYITFDKDLSAQGRDKKINFLFASSELLYSVFAGRDDLVEKLEKTRAGFWNEIIDQEKHRLEKTQTKGKNRTEFKNALSDEFKLIVNSAGLDGVAYADVFDFSLNKYGNILLVYDPVTGITKREKVYKNPKAPKKKKKIDSNS